jgi:succinyl-diaminopimelate desuccinylase
VRRHPIPSGCAHGSTPWQGDNAVIKALHGFHRIEQMGWAQEATELFPRASVNLGRIVGGDALNKVPDRCVTDIDIRYLPGQDPETIQHEIASIGDVEVRRVFHRKPILVRKQRGESRRKFQGQHRKDDDARIQGGGVLLRVGVNRRSSFYVRIHIGNGDEKPD